jgi:hypothetical protein
MAEKRYDFYSYYDYLNYSDFVNLFREHYKFIKDTSKAKFDDKHQLPVKVILEFIARSLCLFQHIPIDTLDSRFNDVFGHNLFQKARLDAYLSDIDLQNKSYRITQSDFLISLMYLLFCDRDNLSNFNAQIYFQNKADESVVVNGFGYFEYKKKIQRYTDITPKRFLTKIEKTKDVKDLNWINLFYIACPKEMLEHITIHLPKELKEFTNYLHLGDTPKDMERLITLNTNKIANLFIKQVDVKEDAKQESTEEVAVPEPKIVDKPQEISLQEYVNENLEKLNSESSQILSVLEGTDLERKEDQFQHSILLNEELYQNFSKKEFEEPITFNGVRLYESKKEFWLSASYQNDELISFLRGEDND